jgi:hypothetical protein
VLPPPPPVGLSSSPLFRVRATIRPTTATIDTAIEPMTTGLLFLPPPWEPTDVECCGVVLYGGGVKAW